MLLRFLTKDDAALARRAKVLLAQAEAGELELRLPSVIVAEVVWTLLSYYGLSRVEVADALSDLIAGSGIVAEDRDLLLEALRVMKTDNVSFIDAYLAERARSENEPVATFDRDFSKLGVQLLPV